MIGELLQLSRENEELRKEISALKAELESLKTDFALDREMFLNEHDENVRLHTALEQEREKSEGLRGALIVCNQSGPGNNTEDTEWMKVYRISSQALLAAKRDEKKEG